MTDTDRRDPDRPPVSVVLPTREWTPACERLTAQVRPDLGDELLLAHDRPSDPVADRPTPEGVRVVLAGEPVGCSGKANAVAAAMERARNDRFVWTDADFPRGPDWLDRLVRAGVAADGPASVLPDFSGGGWWPALDPLVTATLAVREDLLLGDGAAGFPWGGGVTFARGDLRAGVDALLADLRESVSDDLVLEEHVGTARVLADRPARVRVAGDPRSLSHRVVRWFRAEHVRRGLWPSLSGALALAVVGALAPVPTAVATTALAALAYRAVGCRRRTWLLAFPAVFLAPAVLAAGVLRAEFEWGDRRYRLDADGTVTVLDDAGG